jgi:hypothetical protein
VHGVVQACIEVQFRIRKYQGRLPRERDREHMQLVEAQTVLVPQRVGPADAGEPVGGLPRAARFSPRLST